MFPGTFKATQGKNGEGINVLLTSTIGEQGGNKIIEME